MAYANRGRYSVESLALNLLGSTSQSRNAVGAAPDRMLELSAESLRFIWEVEDWYWQRVIGSLAVSNGDTEEAMPDNFRKIDSKWIADKNESGTGLVFTNSPALWKEVWSQYETDEDGEPRIACLIQDTSEADFMKWKAMLAPTADQAYTYPYVYLVTCPIDLDSAGTGYKGEGEVIQMPGPFHRGWRLHGRWQVLMEYGPRDKVAGAKKAYQDWLMDALREHKERMTDPIGPAIDGYGDWSDQNIIGTWDDARRIRGRVAR